MRISTERLPKIVSDEFNIFDNDDRDYSKSAGLLRKNYHET